jgi:solute carrier family 25 (mitochondrial carnitine/acylcarnitine transporter), member 20/29
LPKVVSMASAASQAEALPQQRSHFIKNDFLRAGIASSVGGFVAGCLGIFAGHPFDTLKTRLQIDNGQPIFKRNTTMFAAVRDLYRGILPPTLTVGFMAAINFFIYEKTRRAVTRDEYINTSPASLQGGTNLNGTDIRAVATGAAVSGCVSSLFSAPVSMIKVQQQVVSEEGMFATARALYQRHGGLRVFYRAYPAVFLNETYGRGAYFVMYETSKGWFAHLMDTDTTAREHPINEQHPLAGTLKVRMASAAVAGVFSWLVIYPMDVIKSKLQIDVNGVRYNNSVVRCFQVTYREAGLAGLTRGLGYTLLRAVPVASTVLPIYEYARDALNQHVL